MNGQGTQREYAPLARDYERRWRRYLAATHASTVDALAARAGERVLDIGCGTGLLLARLAATEPSLRLAGCDPTPAMLAEARRRLPATTLLTRAALPRLPFPDAAFDAATLTSVLHHAPNIEASVAEFARVLVPGGRAVVIDWNGDARRMRWFARWLAWRRPASVHLVLRAVLERRLAAAGLRVLACEDKRVFPLWSLVVIRIEKPAVATR